MSRYEIQDREAAEAIDRRRGDRSLMLKAAATVWRLKYPARRALPPLGPGRHP